MIMDHDDCLRIRLNVICLSALIGDLDVEKCPNLPKTRNVEAVPFIAVYLNTVNSANLQVKNDLSLLFLDA